jgi:hypothetical protein
MRDVNVPTREYHHGHAQKVGKTRAHHKSIQMEKMQEKWLLLAVGTVFNTFV